MIKKRKRNGRSILIVEDDRDISEMYCTKFEREGYGVSACYDGKTAIGMVISFKPDVVMLDLLLPFVNGIDVLKAIRKRNNEVPIIICTNLDSNSILRREALSLGANEYIIKSSTTPGELVERVNSYF